jgi:hypothetical protein
MKDFNEMIGSNAKVKTAAKAKAKQTVIIPAPAEVQVEITALLKAKKAKKVAESNIKKAEAPVLDFGIKLKDQNAYQGNFQKSYDIGNDDEHIKLVTANKWSYNEEDVPAIKEIISKKADADELLPKQTDVIMKRDVFKDSDLQKRFFKMVGEAFPEFFETQVSHKVCEDFDKKIYALGPEIVEQLRVYMRQSKPSLR